MVRLKEQRPTASPLGLPILDRFELASVRSDGPQGPILKLGLPPGQSVEQACQQLAQQPGVAYAVPNHLIRQSEQSLYGLENIQAAQGWQIQRGSRQGPLLAVVDSGTDYTHPDLAANVWTNPAEIAGNGVDDDGNGVVDDLHGFNAVAKNGDPMDSGSHGTHTSGTAAAVGDNQQGISGVAQRARLVPCKFIQDGMGDVADAMAAILYADKVGVRVANHSWGGSNYNQALYDTLQASPALHVCAAGNDGSNNDIAPAYPASYDLPNIVAVAAANQDRQLTSFSNYGAASVDLAAPGAQILSTVPGGYALKSGTSMASPHVAGSALLIATQYPELSNQEIKDRLIFGSDRLPQLEGKLVSGGGHLNLASSLEADRVAPAAVTQLQAERLTPEGLFLRWTAPGDDGAVGRAAAYEIRYSHNLEELEKAPTVSAPPPQPAGSAEELPLELLPFGSPRLLHVGLRAVDNVGLRGPLQTIAVEVPAAQVAFYDDGESGPSQWTAGGSWGLLEVPGRGQVWADSPSGEYPCDQNSSLTSQPFSLQGFERPVLSFDCRHDLEINFDKVFLEISPDGQEWKALDSYNLRIGWEKRSSDLSAYKGQLVQLRFRLKTDPDVTLDGFAFDNLVVSERGPKLDDAPGL